MHQLKLSPTFLLVFSTVVSLTMLSGGTSLYLAAKTNLSEHQVRVLENSTATWLTGSGAIFGLLGSKLTDLLEAEEDNEEKK